jgi:hypothetical protein
VSTATTSAVAAPLLSADSSWTAENGTVALSSPGVLTTVTGAAGGWSLTKSGTVAVRPSSLYTGSFSTQAAGTGRQVVPYLYFYDAAGNLLDKVKGDIGQDVTGSWTPSTSVVGLAPTTAATVSLVALTWGTAAGEAHWLTTPTLTATTRTATNVVGPLRTSGNKVYDANGPIVLKGLNLVSLETTSTSPHLTSEDVSQAKRWGATMLRINMSSAFWLSSDCHYDAAYSTLIDTMVQQITSRGMVALLDLHTNNLTGCGTVQQQMMADSTAVDFWTQVASRYKSNPLVAFDLYNEPHDISNAVWLNGGSVTTPGGVTYTAIGMQKLYSTVRATGAQNVTIISGNSWANTLPSARVSGTNIVYGVHAYTCPVAVDATCAANPTQPPAYLAGWDSAATTVPVVATEFGWPSAASGTYNANVVASFKARGWGWTAFGWDGTTTGKFALVSTSGPGASYQPSAAGMPVLTSLYGG